MSISCLFPIWGNWNLTHAMSKYTFAWWFFYLSGQQKASIRVLPVIKDSLLKGGLVKNQNAFINDWELLKVLVVEFRVSTKWSSLSASWNSCLSSLFAINELLRLYLDQLHGLIRESSHFRHTSQCACTVCITGQVGPGPWVHSLLVLKFLWVTRQIIGIDLRTEIMGVKFSDCYLYPRGVQDSG